MCVGVVISPAEGVGLKNVRCHTHDQEVAMAQKSPEKGVAGTAPAVDSPVNVRNVVIVGHSGAGKTTLVEALLAATGTIPRAGSVTDGTTVCDNDPAAVRQQRSVSLACAPIQHNNVKVNLLDTPGYADF